MATMATAPAHAAYPLGLAPPAGARIAIMGGCGGFGRPLVEACLAARLAVAVLDLPGSIARHAPPDGVAEMIACNATDKDAVDDAFTQIGDRMGGLEALVFLVGYTITPPAPLQDLSAAQWADVIDGNLKSAFLTAQAAMPLLRADGGGTVVTVSSGLAYTVLPGFAPYASAKAGLVALTKALAIENAPEVRANAIAPSASQTAFMGGGTARGGDDGGDEWFGGGKFVSTPPLGRLCEPEDVVGPILFFAGPASGFVTGQVLHVNGGRPTP
jgi:3-oxoacyl-[acyl-carrier protein] reductase